VKWVNGATYTSAGSLGTLGLRHADLVFLDQDARNVLQLSGYWTALRAALDYVQGKRYRNGPLTGEN
jgi:hypothetical protein